MKKVLLIILLIFSFTLYSGEYHVRFIIEPYQDMAEGRVIDLNHITSGTAKSFSYYNDKGRNIVIVLSAIFHTVAADNQFYIPSNQDSDDYYDLINIHNSSQKVSVRTIVRYDASPSEESRPFDEHDRIFKEVTFIDVDSNGSVGFYDIYKFGSDPKTYPTSTLYWSDTNRDGNVDSGELFEDSIGAVARTQSSEDIPVRAGLGDTDGDGVDEGEDEDEKDEIDLKDKLPAFENFKQIVGIDGISIPAQQDITFTLNMGFGTYTFNGFQNIGYFNSFRLALRDLVMVFFSWLFIKSVIKTFSEW